MEGKFCNKDERRICYKSSSSTCAAPMNGFNKSGLLDVYLVRWLTGERLIYFSCQSLANVACASNSEEWPTINYSVHEGSSHSFASINPT